MKTFEESVESLNWTQEKEPAWLKEYRKSSFEKFRTLGFPTRQHEGWKYIRLDSILKTVLRRSDLRDGADLAYSIDVPTQNSGEHQIVFVNGIYSPEHSSLQNTKHLSIQTFKHLSDSESQIVKPYAEKTLLAETDAFALVNSFSFADGILVKVAQNSNIREPIRFVFVEDKNVDMKHVYHTKIMVIAENNSKAEIIFEHLGNSVENYFANFDIEIHCDDASQIRWTTISENAFHFISTRVFENRSAQLHLKTINLGQSFTRDETRVDLAGEESSCSLAGTSIIHSDAQAYHHALVNHIAPNTTSRQLYKNILSGSAKAEFNSMVHVHRLAQKSDSNQLNKNLLLSGSARVYSRPQLKIYADDVKATHGSATGPLLRDELFYLRSRGLDAQLAQNILTFGFAEEVLELIELTFLRTQLEQKAQTLLQQMIREPL